MLDKKRELFVEGIDDQMVIKRLLNRRKIEPHFDFNKCEGLPKLKRLVKMAIRVGNHEVIGLVVDADQDVDSRWDELKQLLNEFNYQNIPEKLGEKGAILLPEEDEDLPIVGIWIMPNNLEEGTLEDFVKEMVSDDDQLLPIAEEKVTQLIKQKLNRFTLDQKGKAIMHTWLAWQERPGTQLGKSVVYRLKNRDYLLDDTKSKRFLDWIKKLFK